MTRQANYITILCGLLALFVAVQLLSPKPLDWTPTYLPGDQNPFGASIARRLFDSFFKKEKIATNNLTLYELEDSIGTGDNILSWSNNFNPDDESVHSLLNAVSRGSTAFISAYYFGGKFADTLKLFTSDIFFSELVKKGGIRNDTTDLKLVGPNSEKRGFYYQLDNVSFYFSAIDSLKTDAFVVSTNAWGKPVTLRIPWGKGQFILNTTPLVFTNNYLLYESNYTYASQTLSLMPIKKTWWTSYYQLGRLESQSKLRFILTNESLRWAYYVLILVTLIYCLVEAKRKQRAIPIVVPLANTSLQFVTTIGNLYLQANDHKAIAEKRITYFIDQLRAGYFLKLETGDAFVEAVARKTGNNLVPVQRLFGLIEVIHQAPSISEQMLMDLNRQIEEFNTAKPYH